MNKILLALLLGAIVLVSGCIAPPPPNVKITTCQLSNNQISETQSTSLVLVVRNDDEKNYNSTLSIDKNPKVSITSDGVPAESSISLLLEPKTQITKAFDVKGSLESGMPQATYQITIKEVIDGKNIDTCSLVIVVTK